ncbi:MAG TPA: hypothetical protein VGZ29_07200 [Terriglobia bacterium]|nr:hypothetical protein [Terriglobia bacterium]
MPIRLGKIDFPKPMARLKELGYRGALMIEREISGPKQMEDLKKEKRTLRIS